MNLEKKMYTLMNDSIIKHFMKSEEYKMWFYEIIKGKTGIDLEEYTLYSNEDNTGNSKKDYRMDLVYQHKSKDIKVIVEVNHFSQSGIALLKAYTYLYRVQGNQYQEGEDYSQKHTYLIMFNDFKCVEDEGVKISNKMVYDPLHNISRKDIESWEIYLPNYQEMCYDEITDEIDKRLYLLGVKNMDKLKELNLEEENLKIIKEYERLQKENPGFIRAYERKREDEMTMNTLKKMAREEGLEEGRIEGLAEGRIEGIEQGKEEGKKEGIKEGIITIAKKMIENNKTIEEIQELTGLSLEEINCLKNN